MARIIIMLKFLLLSGCLSSPIVPDDERIVVPGGANWYLFKEGVEGVYCANIACVPSVKVNFNQYSVQQITLNEAVFFDGSILLDQVSTECGGFEDLLFVEYYTRGEEMSSINQTVLLYFGNSNIENEYRDEPVFNISVSNLDGIMMECE